MQIRISQEMVGKISKINKWCFMNYMHLKKLAYDIVGFCMIAQDVINRVVFSIIPQPYFPLLGEYMTNEYSHNIFRSSTVYHLGLQHLTT